MCRLIVASGRFSSAAVLQAAVAMSTGATATHDHTIRAHPNGWGAIWRDADGGLGVHRDLRPLWESWADSPVAALDTGFLAIHARHATLPKNHGEAFTHPLHRAGDPPWYFMHHGFQPTVHRRLGMTASVFDSREYFDYVVPVGCRRLSAPETLARLRAIEPGGTGGNAVAVNPYGAYVIHWAAPDVATPRYFTMSRLDDGGSVVVASDVVESLGAAARWRPLEPATVLHFPFREAGVARQSRVEVAHVEA